MASKYKISTGADLDTVFEPLAGGEAASATGFKSGTADLNTLYHKYVSGAKASTTGFKVGTTDLKDIFQKFGETPASVLWTSTAGSMARTDIGGPPGDLTFTMASTLSVSDNSHSKSSITSPYASGSNSGIEVHWSEGSSSGVGANVTATNWTHETWQEATSNRTLTFDGDQTGYITRTVNVTVGVRLTGDLGSAVYKTIAFTTENQEP